MFLNKWNSFENKGSIYTEPGSPEKIIREAKLDKKNNIIVEKKGTESLYKFINSFAESCDLNVIMNRFLNGDKEVLLQRVGAFMDISTLPKDYQSLVNINVAAGNAWRVLPVEVKEKFDNNIYNFMVKAGSDEWTEILSTSKHEIMKEKDKEIRDRTQKLKDEVQHKPIVENPGIDAPEEGDIK